MRPGRLGGRPTESGSCSAVLPDPVIRCGLFSPTAPTFHEVFTDAEGRGAGCAIWSPNGKFILFCLNPPGSLATLSDAPSNGLYIIRADGTDLTPVVVTDDFKATPDWTAGE